MPEDREISQLTKEITQQRRRKHAGRRNVSQLKHEYIRILTTDLAEAAREPPEKWLLPTEAFNEDGLHLAGALSLGWKMRLHAAEVGLTGDEIVLHTPQASGGLIVLLPISNGAVVREGGKRKHTLCLKWQ